MAVAKAKVNRIAEVDGKAASKAAKEEKVSTKFHIPRLEKAMISVPIIGTSPLVVHAFGPKARKMIEDKQQQKPKGARGKREQRNEYLECFYMIEGEPEAKGAVYGFPCSAFRAACIGACRFVDGVTMTVLRGVLFVLEDGVDCRYDRRALTRIDTKSGPRFVEDVVRLPNKSADLRYRPYFDDWSATLRIQYVPRILSAEQVLNLVMYAGMCQGIGDQRPECGKENGQFDVDWDRVE